MTESRHASREMQEEVREENGQPGRGRQQTKSKEVQVEQMTREEP